VYVRIDGIGLTRFDGAAFVPLPGGERFTAEGVAYLEAQPEGALKGKIDSKYAALYFPWITIANPGAALDPLAPKEIDVPPSGPVRVDWRVARREWLARLGWTEDRDNPDLRVLPSIEMLDTRPAVVVGSGYTPRSGLAQPVTTFLEASPLVSGLNLDVAERSGMSGAPSLPPGFNAVLSGPESAVWIAERAAPVAAFVPGLPLDGDDNVARFSSTVFLNAARWILERRPRPALFTLTSPDQPEPSGNRLALHPGEGNTGRTPRSVGTFDPRAPRGQQAERRLALWPWLVGAAALVFLTERALALLRGAL